MITKKNSTYLNVNLIFITLIFFLFLYSLLFPFLPYKIPSLCNETQIVFCKSKGLSRAYAEIMRLNFDKAQLYNGFSIRTFIFFVYGFLSRIFYSLVFFRIKSQRVIYIDVVISTMLFMICFSVLL